MHAGVGVALLFCFFSFSFLFVRWTEELCKLLGCSGVCKLVICPSGTLC